MSEFILKAMCLITFRSSFFGSSANIEPAVEEKEGMGSTHNLQVEVPDVRRTVSFFWKRKLQHEQGPKICNNFMVHNGDKTTMST